MEVTGTHHHSCVTSHHDHCYFIVKNSLIFGADTIPAVFSLFWANIINVITIAISKDNTLSLTFLCLLLFHLFDVSSLSLQIWIMLKHHLMEKLKKIMNDDEHGRDHDDWERTYAKEYVQSWWHLGNHPEMQKELSNVLWHLSCCWNLYIQASLSRNWRNILYCTGWC